MSGLYLGGDNPASDSRRVGPPVPPSSPAGHLRNSQEEVHDVVLLKDASLAPPSFASRHKWALAALVAALALPLIAAIAKYGFDFSSGQTIESFFKDNWGAIIDLSSWENQILMYVGMAIAGALAVGVVRVCIGLYDLLKTDHYPGLPAEEVEPAQPQRTVRSAARETEADVALVQAEADLQAALATASAVPPSVVVQPSPVQLPLPLPTVDLPAPVRPRGGQESALLRAEVGATMARLRAAQLQAGLTDANSVFGRKQTQLDLQIQQAQADLNGVNLSIVVVQGQQPIHLTTQQLNQPMAPGNKSWATLHSDIRTRLDHLSKKPQDNSVEIANLSLALSKLDSRLRISDLEEQKATAQQQEQRSIRSEMALLAHLEANKRASLPEGVRASPLAYLGGLLVQ